MTAVSVFFVRQTYMKVIALKKSSQIQRGNASIFDVTSPDTCVRHLVSPIPVPQLFTR